MDHPENLIDNVISVSIQQLPIVIRKLQQLTNLSQNTIKMIIWKHGVKTQKSAEYLYNLYIYFGFNDHGEHTELHQTMISQLSVAQLEQMIDYSNTVIAELIAKQYENNKIIKNE